MFLEWQRAQLLIGGWRERYQQSVLDGSITLQASVDDYLASL